MQAGVGLLDTDVMPIFMIIALDIIITLHFSINCSVVICSPTVIFSILREASSETYGPRVYFPSYKFPIYNFSFRFTFFAIFYFPFHKPKILLYRLSISIDLTLQITVKGLTTPLSRWVQVGVCLCRNSVTCVFSPTGLIPWFSKLREILTLLCYITLSSSREKPTQAQQVPGRISGAIAGEDSRLPSTCQFMAPLPARSMPSQDIPSTHHKLSSLALHYLPFASRFPLHHF